jgi:hypothetical protein
MSATRSCSKLLEPSATESIAVRSELPVPRSAAGRSKPIVPKFGAEAPAWSLPEQLLRHSFLLSSDADTGCCCAPSAPWWQARCGRSSRWRARPPSVEVRACSTVEVVAEPPPTRAPRPVSRLGAPRWGSMSRPLPWGSAWRPPLRSSAPSRLPARSKLPPVHEELPLAHSLSPSTTPASLWPSLIPHVLGLGINCCLL